MTKGKTPKRRVTYRETYKAGFWVDQQPSLPFTNNTGPAGKTEILARGRMVLEGEEFEFIEIRVFYKRGKVNEVSTG